MVSSPSARVVMPRVVAYCDTGLRKIVRVMISTTKDSDSDRIRQEGNVEENLLLLEYAVLQW